MSFKAKIKSRFRSKFPKVNLSTKRLNAIADRLAEKLEDDSDDEAIDARLDAIDEITPFADMAAEDDTLRNALANQKDKDPDPKDDKQPDPNKPADDKAPTDFVTALNAALAPLVNQITALQQDKVNGGRRAQVEAALGKTDEKYKAQMLKAFGRMSFEKDADFDEYLEELTTDAADFIQASADKKLSDQPGASILGTKNKDGISSGVAEYMAMKKAGGDATVGKPVFQPNN